MQGIFLASVNSLDFSISKLDKLQIYAEIWPIPGQKLKYGRTVFLKNFSYWNTIAIGSTSVKRSNSTVSHNKHGNSVTIFPLSTSAPLGCKINVLERLRAS